MVCGLGTGNSWVKGLFPSMALTGGVANFKHEQSEVNKVTLFTQKCRYTVQNGIAKRGKCAS